MRQTAKLSGRRYLSPGQLQQGWNLTDTKTKTKPLGPLAPWPFGPLAPHTASLPLADRLHTFFFLNNLWFTRIWNHFNNMRFIHTTLFIIIQINRNWKPLNVNLKLNHNNLFVLSFSLKSLHHHHHHRHHGTTQCSFSQISFTFFIHLYRHHTVEGRLQSGLVHLGTRNSHDCRFLH